MNLCDKLDASNFISSTDSMDPYEKLDALNLISSVNVLREIYKRTDDLFIKKEIVRICKDDRIYQLALNERNEILKIAVIRAIYRNLQSNWNLEEDMPPKAVSVLDDDITSNENTEEPIEQEIEFESTNDHLVTKEEKEEIAEEKTDIVIPDDTRMPVAVEMNTNIPTMVINTTEDVDIFAQESQTEENIKEEEKEEKEKETEPNEVKEEKEEKKAEPPKLTKQAISQIFNMYTLVDLIRSSPPELHDDIHAQIKRVLDSQRILDELDKM